MALLRTKTTCHDFKLSPDWTSYRLMDSQCAGRPHNVCTVATVPFYLALVSHVLLI